MTQAQLKKRVQFWQGHLAELGLFGWDIDVQVVDEPERRYQEQPAVASVSTSTHYDSAWMEFSKESLAEYSDRQIDKTIIHELLHIVFRDFKQATEEPRHWMPPSTHNTWCEFLEHEEEGIIERIARTLAALYHDE